MHGKLLHSSVLVGIYARIYALYKLIRLLDLDHRKYRDRPLDCRGDTLLCKYFTCHSERS